jgi:eukaryotic-like serine/threonine-protein kinase
VQPFRGNSAADIFDSLLNRTPEAPVRLNPTLPPELEHIINKALEKDPNLRYQGLAEMRADLQRLKRDMESGHSRATGAEGSHVAVSALAAPSAPASSRVERTKSHRSIWMSSAVAGALILAIGVWLRFGHRSVHALNEKDTVVLADFTNTTGDSIFDGTLRQGLASQLEQSPFLSLVSDDRLAQTLKLLAKPGDSRLTHQLARQVCQRTGSKATLEGAISGLGTPYKLQLSAVDCRSGDVLAEMHETASGKEQVLPALGKVATKMREKLGESLVSVQKYDAPAENVTTGSLEALQAYSLGYRAMNVSEDFAGAISLFERATHLDPNFALAYARMAVSCGNTAQIAKAAENSRKAYDLRQRVSQREKFDIEGTYHNNVTRNSEAARKTYEAWALAYPRDDIPPNDLGIIYTRLGEHEKALSAYQQSLRLDPDSGISYGNVLRAYINLNRVDEAKATIQEAQARKLDFPNLHLRSYDIALLQQDASGIEREAAYLAGRPELALGLLYSESETAAYGGQMSRARELANRVIDAIRRAGNRDVVGGVEVQVALREALMGNTALAKRQAEDAMSISDNEYVQALSATVLALAGDSAKATRLASDLAMRHPENTSMKFHYLPMTSCAIAMNERMASPPFRADARGTPYELGDPDWMSYIRLYPVYLRGQAYLAAHQAAPAAMEFQKILDHPGLVLNEPIGPLAHLGLGRAYAMTGDPAKAKTAYQDFLVLWKEADPEVPILVAAKKEYAKLK